MDNQQEERFQKAVEEKKRQAKEASEQAPAPSLAGGSSASREQRSLVEPGRPQDTRDERKKNAGHGKKTADKWNQ